MRKLILNLAISLDGFIEGPNGEYDWCFTDQDYGMSAFFQRVDASFMGRKSYELTQSMAESGIPPLKTYVFSTTLKKVKEEAVLVSQNIKQQVAAIKQEPGKDIWLFGGASLTRSLLNLDLVDEISLAVHPIVLGGGTPLFKDITERKNLELLSSKAYDSGLVVLNYSPKNRIDDH